MSNSLTERLLKNSTLKGRTATLDKSKVHNKRELVPTPIPAINIGLSGSPTGGLGCGLTTIAGPSKHFKTLFGLIITAAYMKAKPNSVCVFYDSEFGAGTQYFKSVGIDPSRVVHTPITNIEELKFDIMKQLDELEEKDEVIFFIDSIGNLASKKEVDDAMDMKSVADMTRAKQLKSLWRMVTPHLNLKDIPLIAISHIYMTQEMFSKAVVSGGTGGIYASDTIWIVGRQQEKEGSDLTGYNFVINIEKSRFVKEKSKINVTVRFDGGIDKWSGLLELAEEFNYVSKPRKGYYVRNCVKDDKQTHRKKTSTKEFWAPIFENTDFLKDIEKKYKLATETPIVVEDENE